MIISVIVPCRNEKNHIRDFLDSVCRQELEPPWRIEVLIADGMSNDGTREILREYAGTCAQVRIIDNPGRITPTGLNAAIQAAGGSVIVRMDVHTTYARDYIRECIRALAESGADNVGGPWIAEGKGVMGRAIAAAFRSPLCGGKAHDPGYQGEVDTVYLGCWPREVFDRVGLFDPGLVRNQDDEFNFRLRRQGGRVWQTPRVRSCYTPRASLGALFRQYMQYGFWKVAVIRKHKALAAWRHLLPAMFVSSILAGVLLALIAAAAGAGAVAITAMAVLAAELLGYLAVCAATSVTYARGLGAISAAILPVVIGVYHFSYGLGFLAGAIQFIHPGPKKTAPSRVFSELTR